LIVRALLMSAACLLAGCSGTVGAGAIDPAFVGTWQARGTVMTSSMQRTGTFALRIERDGTYLLASQGGSEFVVDSGRYSTARDGGYVRTTASGLEDRGTYVRSGGGFRLRSFYGELAASPAAPGSGGPAFTRLATLLRVPPRNHVSHWVSRAAQYAQLWQADARLDTVSMTDFDDRGLLKPTSMVTISFYSPSHDTFLLLSPTRSGTGAMTMSVAPRAGRAVAARGIPVPVVDFAMLVNRQRDAGVSARYATADLRYYGEGGAPRLLWLARTQGGAGFERHCLDAATVAVVDCRRFAGDPEKELAALQRRAAAAWAAMQQRWSSGDSSSGDLSYLPPSDFDRCGSRGGSFNGVGCYDSIGSEIRGY
jgi:hypothetical protein